jgi:two-component system, NarL family, nitrate/nitrite response regulator NarL
MGVMATDHPLRTVRKVVLLSASALSREALSLALERFPWIQVLAVASASEAADLLLASTPDALLVQLPLIVGAPVMRELLKVNPRVRLVALDAEKDEHESIAWADAGAAVRLTRGSSIDDLVRLIKSLGGAPHEGRSPIESVRSRVRPDPCDTADGDDPFAFCAAGLTRRQSEVFGLLARGLSNKQIAAALSIELATVKNHVHSVLEKLGVRSRIEAIVIGRELAAGRPVPIPMMLGGEPSAARVSLGA